MTTIYVPRMSAEDYPAFQNIAGLDLPADYGDWLRQRERFKAASPENGDTVVEVDVNPSEFLRYLQVTRSAADLKELQALASAKMSTDADTPGSPEDNIIVARRLSAEEWMAEVDSIIQQYHEVTGLRGYPPMARKRAIERLVQLGFSEGDAVRYLDRKRAKPVASHR